MTKRAQAGESKVTHRLETWTGCSSSALLPNWCTHSKLSYLKESHLTALAMSNLHQYIPTAIFVLVLFHIFWKHILSSVVSETIADAKTQPNNKKVLEIIPCTSFQPELKWKFVLFWRKRMRKQRSAWRIKTHTDNRYRNISFLSFINHAF